MLELAAMTWMMLAGVNPLVLPLPTLESAPLLVDTLQLQRVEAKLEFRPIDIAFPRVDAHELKPFDEAVAVVPRSFENDELKTPSF